MKLQVFGFAFIVAAAVGGVDYSMQAKEADQSLGVNGYFASVSGRFEAASEARARTKRQEADVKIHLPEAPEDWIRSAWAETDTTVLEPQISNQTRFQKTALSATELAPMLGGMAATDVQLSTKMRRTTIWIYERGEEIIALRVIYTKTGAVNRFPGMDDKIKRANERGINTATAFAFVQGVGFGEVRLDHKLTGPVKYRAFAASMGTNVTIGVRAVASDASILAMMQAINIDGLNGMLDVPLMSVGKDAPQLNARQAMEMATQAIEARRAVLRGDEPVVAVEQAAEVQDTVTEPEVKAEVEDEPALKIAVGFKTVSGLPGQKCVLKAGSRFCGVVSE